MRELTTQYVELHCHSNYSFQEGASFIHELLARAGELDYPALALTDHDNLCGAMEFAQAARSLGIQPIIGAEITLTEGHHITLLAETQRGYRNLCQLLSSARITTNRREPELDPRFLAEHAQGLILLSGCPKGELPSLVQGGRLREAEEVAERYIQWFGKENVYLELQQNLVYGDTARIRRMAQMASGLGIGVVATNNAHYHLRERHQLQDCLVSIKHRKSLDESHRTRRANSEFYLKSTEEMAELFQDYPDAIASTVSIAQRCSSFDLTRDLGYRFPESPVPDGYTQESYLHHLCEEAAIRRYGSINDKIKARLDEEFRLIRRHNLAGFLLIYHDIIQLAREVMIDLGLTDMEIPLEENPPGRGRGSSVAMLTGYLIGLSHIDPLQFNLSLERFLPDDDMATVPDIDLDFPRNIREELIKRVHETYGWERAALTGMISTYKLKGAVRDLGLALGLPMDQVDKLAKRADHGHARSLASEMAALPEFRNSISAPGWRDLVRLAGELDGFPKYLAQHPGGMVIGSEPLTDLVPIQPSAIKDRYVMHWDKDSIDDAGFVKIDFLALGALSQMQDALDLIEERTGHRPDLSRIDFEDQDVYDMICEADTIGIFQVESAAQMQTTPRIKPRNLFDMAHEVAAVRPGVGVNDGVSQYIRRRSGVEPTTFEHDLERRALEKTHGVILFQDQVNQVAMDIAGFSPLEADQLRQAYGRRNSLELLQVYWEKFRDGAASNGIDEETAKRIFAKFNGHYMFPESHAFAFGVTAYQAAWMKLYYPLEFYVAIFNQQPMGFYNLETLKEDARRHGIQVLNPDINRSFEKCVIESDSMRLGLLNVALVGPTAARAITEVRSRDGHYRSIAEFMERTGSSRKALENLSDAGAFDAIVKDRRAVRWEIGLRYRPVNRQLALSLPVEQDKVDLNPLSPWERMEEEYQTMGLHPTGHVMAYLREQLGPDVITSTEVAGLEHGTKVSVAGLVIRRQRPLGKAVFITLEDEYGHTPLVLWPKTYERYRQVFREPLVIASGTVSRREGTMNVLVTGARKMPAFEMAPRSKDWS
ncbi:MAG: DNA polymerase III subunit alpha [Chloroflexi bacterium]|nr:DNA polymerase III subunit alpha [Chloroflexota bacterium]